MTNDVTLYDLMAQDLDVWLVRGKKFGYDLTIEDEEGVKIVDKEEIHPCAIDSMADFCRSFLAFYDQINHREAA